MRGPELLVPTSRLVSALFFVALASSTAASASEPVGDAPPPPAPLEGPAFDPDDGEAPLPPPPPLAPTGRRTEERSYLLPPEAAGAVAAVGAAIGAGSGAGAVLALGTPLFVAGLGSAFVVPAPFALLFAVLAGASVPVLAGAGAALALLLIYSGAPEEYGEVCLLSALVYVVLVSALAGGVFGAPGVCHLGRGWPFSSGPAAPRRRQVSVPFGGGVLGGVVGGIAGGVLGGAGAALWQAQTGGADLGPFFLGLFVGATVGAAVGGTAGGAIGAYGFRP